jgi:hypothetical protein
VPLTHITKNHNHWPFAVVSVSFIYIIMSSDSSYVAATRHRRPYSTSGRPPVLEIVDDAWASDKLSDDEVEVARHEAAVAPLLEEGELDADAIVVSPTGNSASAANNAAERRRREEGWTDLGLDQLDSNVHGGNSNAAQTNASTGAN